MQGLKKKHSENNKRTKRIMIIVWTWKYDGLEAPYDEWSLNSKKYAGDKVIRVDAPWSPQAQKSIQELVKKNISEGHIYLFLHRNHGYNYKIIDQILSLLKVLPDATQKLRCFLFGEGNDYIYIAKQPRGLLGTKGTFSAIMPTNNNSKSKQLISAVADYDRKVLKKEHFDNTWKYYTNTFKAKIFELKEDLFANLLTFHQAAQTESQTLYNHIKQQENRLLFLRLLSFTGKVRKGSDLELALKKYENDRKKSYLFDDCHVNLKIIYGEEESALYKQLVLAINQGLLGRDDYTDLIRLRDQFDSLLAALPESTYY